MDENPYDPPRTETKGVQLGASHFCATWGQRFLRGETISPLRS